MRRLKISKSTIQTDEWGQVTALRTHLGVLIQYLFHLTDGRLVVQEPLEIDPGQILLVAASLRALIFDDTGTPLLLSFLRRHGLDITVNSFEGDFAMLYYAQTKPNNTGHLAQFLLSLIVDERQQIEFPVGVQKIFVLSEDRQIPTSLANTIDTWAPTDDNTYMGADLANDDQVVQLCRVTRRHAPIAEWGNLRMGYLKDIPIRRKSIIEYTANRLGGVHYDTAHHTMDKERANEFRLLTKAYNWEDRAIMHGAVVATAISAIEVAVCRELIDLYCQLGTEEESRRDWLLNGSHPEDDTAT